MQYVMKSFAMFYIFFSLISCGSGDGDSSPVVGSLGEQRKATAVITPEEGGELELETAAGDHLTLTVPPYAVDEETEISVTWLAEVPETTAMDVRFALRFAPDGLEFYEPAHLVIKHAAAFPEDDDIALFWIVSAKRLMAVTHDPISAMTDVYLPHFSSYVGAKAGSNMKFSCMEANWLDPADTCLQNLPVVGNLMRCASQASRDGRSQEEIWEYIHIASDLFRGSFDRMRAKAIPQDDYCHRSGSQSGRYINDLFSCINVPGAGTPAFLDDDDYDHIYKGITDAATELAQAWLDSSPPKGDSCYKLGKTEKWLEYASCLTASGLHNLEDHELFSSHFLVGQAMVQDEFLGTTQPSNHDELCGWYFECLEGHVKNSELTRIVSTEAAHTAAALETRYGEVLPQCNNLWDVTIKLDVQEVYEFAGMNGYTADYTVTVKYEDIALAAERENMQSAARQVDELGGIAPGESASGGGDLLMPFYSSLSGGGRFIQMSFMLDINAAKSWDIVDNGSEYNCIMEFACDTITDFEVRRHDFANFPGTPEFAFQPAKAQMMVMRSLADQSLSWGRNELPQNTGYLIWRFENMVDVCSYDSDEGEWDCDTSTMGTMAEPRPGEDPVVSEPEAPEFRFFNARLTPQQVKNILDRVGFSYSYDLTSRTSVNDGAVTSDTTQNVTVTLTPKN